MKSIIILLSGSRAGEGGRGVNFMLTGGGRGLLTPRVINHIFITMHEKIDFIRF